MGTVADVKLYIQGVGVKRFGDLTTKEVAGATRVRVVGRDRLAKNLKLPLDNMKRGGSNGK
jgi:hypothetical protein